MLDIEKMIGLVKEKFLPVAENEVADLAQGAWSDAETFVKDSRDDLTLWTDQLAKGEMSAGGLALAVRGRAAVLQMKALADAGIAQVKTDRLKEALVGSIVSTVRDTLRA